MQHTIFIADDDVKFLAKVERLLIDDGYEVLKARTERAILSQLEHHLPSLLLLSLDMADVNTVALCAKLRANPYTEALPIVFLTTQQRPPEAIAAALNAGADDYLMKTVDPRVMAARVRAQLRRVRSLQESHMPLLSIDSATHSAMLDGRPLDLTRVEYNLLCKIATSGRDYMNTRQLLTEVWNYPGGVGDAALVRNHVRNLRLKLEPNPKRPTVLVSRPRRGYAVRARVQMRSHAPDGDC